MKTILIIILIGLIAIPLISYFMYGNMREIWPWFALLGVLVLVVVIFKGKGTKLF
jgi:hypothetical protein